MSRAEKYAERYMTALKWITVAFVSILAVDYVITEMVAEFGIAYDEAALTLAALATAVAIAMQDRIVRWICRQIP